MAFNEKEQQIIQWGLQNGKSKAETQEALSRFRITGSPADPNRPVEPEPSFTQRVGEGFSQTRQNIAQQVRGTGEFEGQTPIRRGAELAAEVTSVPLQVGIQALPEGVRNVLGKVGEKASNIINFLGEKIGSTERAQRLVNDYPEVANVIEEVAGISGATSEAAGNVLALEGGVAGARSAGRLARNVTNQARQGLGVDLGGVAQRGTNLRNKVQTVLSQKNVNPQLESSANRLFLEGTERIGSPVAKYDEFLSQSKKALQDIKVDPAVAVVGENVGNQFSKVVKMRRDVGKAMSDLIKEVQGVETNILGSVDDFVKNLTESGVIYDRVSKTVRQRAGQTKFTQPDIKLLETYAQELQKLGSTPTVGELDAFLSRISGELDLYKASNNIIGTTNAERIIKESLRDMRNQFNPDVTGNEALRPYYDARQTYSELSNFVQDGQRYLGKVTQSGDFAKDASLVKSSVQSILNNGKKDFLIELEALTGYPILDEAVLALQAMADAGDFRGTSLLQVLSEGSIPISKLGLVDKILNFGVEKGKEALIGSPEEQTRLFLRNLESGLQQ